MCLRHEIVPLQMHFDFPLFDLSELLCLSKLSEPLLLGSAVAGPNLKANCVYTCV